MITCSNNTTKVIKATGVLAEKHEVNIPWIIAEWKSLIVQYPKIIWKRYFKGGFSD